MAWYYGKQTTREELARRYAGGERNFANFDLIGKDLSGLQLDGIRLSKCHMWNAKLAGASLVGADLTHANAVGVDFGGANLTNANLSIGTFRESNFKKALVRSADLSWADFDDADFRDAIVERTVFSGAKFRNARLDGLNLEHARLDVTVFVGANLSAANLFGAQLQNASFGETNMTEAHLEQANLKGAFIGKSDLSRAVLNGANFSEATISSDVIFDGASLAGAILADIDLAAFCRAKDLHVEQCTVDHLSVQRSASEPGIKTLLERTKTPFAILDQVDPLFKRIAQGETRDLDLKRELDFSNRKACAELARDIIAFANSGGGVIAIGVENSGRVLGLSEAQLEELDPTKLNDKVKKYTGGQAPFTRRILRQDGRAIIALEVYPAEARIVFAGSDDENAGLYQGRIYVRTHDAASRAITDAEALNALVERVITERVAMASKLVASPKT